MIRANILSSGLEFFARFAWGLVYFPLWWYGAGFIRHAGRVWRFLKDEERALGFSVWARNWLVPMYGQSDFVGRLISFVMRTVQIIARGALLFIWALLGLLLAILWLALPPVIILACAYQLIGE
ncbi:MAG: hypothetical protein ACM3PZ_01895 [Bacillota bacterium]